MSFPGLGAGASRPGLDPNDPNVKKLNAMMESCFAKTAMSGVAGFGLGGIFGLFMASMAYDTPYHTAVPSTATPTTVKPAVPATTTTITTTTTTATTATSPGTIASKLPPTTMLKTPLPTGTAAAAAASITGKTTAAAAAAAATSSSAAGGAAAGSAAAPVLKPPNGPITAVGAAASQAAESMVPISELPWRRQVAIGFKDMGTRSWSTAKNFAMVGALFSGIECGIEGLRAKNDAANGVGAGCITGAILARNGGPQAAAVGCVGFAAFSAAIEAYLRQPKDE